MHTERHTYLRVCTHVYKSVKASLQRPDDLSFHYTRLSNHLHCTLSLQQAANYPCVSTDVCGEEKKNHCTHFFCFFHTFFF